jgi:methionine-rich copper-binding protein CopC
VCAKLVQRCLAVALGLLLPCGPVLAHAGLEHADPAAGSHLAAAPARVTLRFTERLEPAFSRLEVDDAAGRRVDRGDAAVPASDAAVLAVSLPALPPGRYIVKWHVLSVDTHATEGHFDFEVAH